MMELFSRLSAICKNAEKPVVLMIDEVDSASNNQVFMDYLDYYHKDRGYMLSFNFNKKKDIGVKEIKIGNKTIVEAVV